MLSLRLPAALTASHSEGRWTRRTILSTERLVAVPSLTSPSPSPPLPLSYQS